MTMRCLLLALTLATASCSETASPTRLILFDGPRLVGQLEAHPTRLAEPGPGDWIRVHQVILPSDREPAPWPAVTEVRIGLPGYGDAPHHGGPDELHSGAEQLSLAQLPSGFSDLDTLPDGVFFVMAGKLYLLDRTGRFADQTLDYYAWIERKPRVSLRGITCDGLLLLPGESFTMNLPSVAGPAAELVFGSAVFGAPNAAAVSSLSIEVDGNTVFQTKQDPALTPVPAAHRVRLPSSAACQLTFRVQGGDGIGLFATPIVTSVQPADPEDERPDIVLFLVDTFRADNLALWGGDPKLAPNMNAFAASSLTFTGARSPATWTLPAQASLLTSLFPYQHSAVRSDMRLPDGLETLPERLRAAGYRTAAITDGVMVTARHGLDRGFELFLDAPLDKDFERSTLTRLDEVLALDDGRPLFVYVQTYRVHSPYVASAETLAAHPELFGTDPDPADWEYLPIFSKLGKAAEKARLSHDPEDEAQVRSLAATILRLYRGGVADFDHDFAKLRTLLAEHGRSEPILVLTSDHGESFFEHRSVSHGTSIHEEETRVPLILSAPGLEPGLVERTVTLIDLAPTLTALVGVDPAPGWVGRSLLAPTAAGTNTFSFMAEIDGFNENREFALYDGSRKIVGFMRDGQLFEGPQHAFDLGSDPRENIDLLAHDQPAWIQALFTSRRAELEAALHPRAEADELELTETERANLAAMGYTGD